MTNFPEIGDIVVIDAEPHSGKEFGGYDANADNVRRHMVVMSSTQYNQTTGMIVAMPITTSDRHKNEVGYYPILINGGRNGVKGFVAIWQLQNFDFKSRNGKVINKITQKQYSDLRVYVRDILNF